MHHLQLALGLLAAAAVATAGSRRFQGLLADAEQGLYVAGFASMGMLVLALAKAFGR
jgi:hypothetical protein